MKPVSLLQQHVLLRSIVGASDLVLAKYVCCPPNHGLRAWRLVDGAKCETLVRGYVPMQAQLFAKHYFVLADAHYAQHAAIVHNPIAKLASHAAASAARPATIPAPTCSQGTSTARPAAISAPTDSQGTCLTGMPTLLALPARSNLF